MKEIHESVFARDARVYPSSAMARKNRPIPAMTKNPVPKTDGTSLSLSD